MQIVLTSNVAEVPEQVDEFVAQRIERNVQATLLTYARAARLGGRPLFGWGSSDAAAGAGAVRFFAMRTPPWPLLVADLDPAWCETLLERWLELDPDIPGCSGVPATTRALGAAWAERTNGSASCTMREAIHVLSEVDEPEHPPAGALRSARESERDMLIAWERAFVAEAGLTAGAADQAPSTIARRLSSSSQYVWDDGGVPASTLTISPCIAGTVRIGPVYTPPERRGRGYASAAVARACIQALDDGAEQCMLFTDLANPTSNKIYSAIGFRRCGEWEEHTFAAAR